MLDAGCWMLDAGSLVQSSEFRVQIKPKQPK